MRITTVISEPIGQAPIMRTTIRVEEGDRNIVAEAGTHFGIHSTARTLEFEDTPAFRNWLCRLASDICFEEQYRGLQGA